MGHSYGGYTTLSLIVQTDRFKAAISIDGDSDLVGSYGEMEENASAYGVAIAEHGQGAMGGTPWERRDAFIENSPFFYFDRIQTPLLIVQGSKDTAVALFLGDQIFCLRFEDSLERSSGLCEVRGGEAFTVARVELRAPGRSVLSHDSLARRTPEIIGAADRSAGSLKCMLSLLIRLVGTISRLEW